MDNISYIFRENHGFLPNARKKDWNDFSLCEKIIIESIGKKKNMSLGTVINAVGSSQDGGFLFALLQKFHVSSYYGFNTNEGLETFCQHFLKKKNCKANFFQNSLAEALSIETVDHADTVFALDFLDHHLFIDESLFHAAWSKVKLHGHLILSFKMIPGSAEHSLQKVCDFFNQMTPKPSRILGYGQWAEHEGQAIIPAVFSLQKNQYESCETEFFFPLDLYFNQNLNSA